MLLMLRLLLHELSKKKFFLPSRSFPRLSRGRKTKAIHTVDSIDFLTWAPYYCEYYKEKNCGGLALTVLLKIKKI